MNLRFVRRISLFFALSAVTCTMLFAQTRRVTVLPKEVYVGDSMEIRYMFSAETKILEDSMEYLVVQPPEMKDCTIQKMTVARFGTEYMLSVHCIPWSPGVLDIPPVTLPVVTEFSDEPCVVDVPPVIIQSIVEHTQKKDLRPVKAPLVIPGTTWLIYGLSIFAVVAVVLLVLLFIHIKGAYRRVRYFISLIGETLNYKSFRRKIKRLMRRQEKYDSVSFALVFSKYIKKYISNRFKHPFESETTSGVRNVLFERYNGLWSKKCSEAASSVADILLRCDSVRFSGDETGLAELPAGERKLLCQRMLEIAFIFEKEEIDADI